VLAHARQNLKSQILPIRFNSCLFRRLAIGRCIV
jgi:hypothetical protein